MCILAYGPCESISDFRANLEMELSRVLNMLWREASAHRIGPVMFGLILSMDEIRDSVALGHLHTAGF